MSGFVLTHAGGCSAGTPRGLITHRAIDQAPAGSWLDWLAQAMRVVGTRRHLAQMDDRMLKDIGISRSEALEEARRAPWDLGPRSV